MNNLQTALDFNEKQRTMFEPILHGRENNIESQKNYEANIEAFTKNCKVIFAQLMTGKVLTGIDCAKLGILEYRRRFKDLIDVYGIPVQDDYVEGKRHKNGGWKRSISIM